MPGRTRCQDEYADDYKRAPLQLAGLGQLLQGATPPGTPRARRTRPSRCRSSTGRTARRCSATSIPASASRRWCSTTAALWRSRTRSSGTSATARSTCPTIRTSARRCCSGCSSSSTATSRTSRSRASGRRYSGEPERFERQRDRLLPAATRARRDGAAPRRAGLPRRRAVLDRRHLALRVHARRARGRLRPRAVSGDPSLARARSRTAGARRDRRLSPRAGPRPLRAEPDGLAAPRERADRRRQPRFADEHGRRARPADRRHRPARNVEGGEEAILGDLAWLEVAFDEGPVRQSERGALYAEAAERARRGRRDPRRGRRRAPRRRRDDAPPARRDRDLPARVGRGRPRARDHARHPRLGSPPEPPGPAADRTGARGELPGGDPPRARPRSGREEALEAARPLLDRRAARRGLPGRRRACLPRRARPARARRPARSRALGRLAVDAIAAMPDEELAAAADAPLEVVPALRGARTLVEAREYARLVVEPQQASCGDDARPTLERFAELRAAAPERLSLTRRGDRPRAEGRRRGPALAPPRADGRRARPGARGRARALPRAEALAASRPA